MIVFLTHIHRVIHAIILLGMYYTTYTLHGYTFLLFHEQQECCNWQHIRTRTHTKVYIHMKARASTSQCVLKHADMQKILIFKIIQTMITY